MIQELSSKVAQWLEQEGAISGEDNGLFSYAVYSLLFGLLPIFIVVILGLAFGMLREGLLMITPFMLIRKFSGGYHLQKPRTCFFVSTLLIVSVCGLMKANLQIENQIPLSGVVILSCITLCILSPIDSDSRKLNNSEKKVFRRVAQIMSCSLMFSYFLFLFFEFYHIAIPLGMGLAMAASLQLPCLITHSR